MRKVIFVFVFTYLAAFLGCAPQHEHYSADLTIEPKIVESGKPVELTFEIKNPKLEVVSDLEIVHEKPMHLFMVSEDLSQYFHEHPRKQKDGKFTLPFTFPNGGKFKVFIDFKPKDDEQTVESFDIDVKGAKLEKVELKPDEKFEKAVENLLVKMKPNADLTKQKDIMLNFEVFDAGTKKPANDLQDYLGAKAHFVIIRKGLGRFVHAHPMKGDMMSMDKESNMPGMAASQTYKISAMTNFPNSGIYKIFAQFKRSDEVITVPFVFEVK